jgi:hypothetical protein
MIYENPYPVIKADWESGHYQWREITSLAYRELLQETTPLHQSEMGFMQSEAVGILTNDAALYVCCWQLDGFYFARLLPAAAWYYIHQALPLPEIDL